MGSGGSGGGMGGDGSGVDRCCKMKHVDSKDKNLSGLYILLSTESYWKMPSYCYSPCVYVKMEDLRELQKAMNGTGGDYMDGSEDPVPMDGNKPTSRRPDMQTGSGLGSDYEYDMEGSGYGNGNQDKNMNKLQKFIKRVNRLQKYCFRPSFDTEAMCASEFFPDGFGLMSGMESMEDMNIDMDMDMDMDSTDSMGGMGSGDMSGRERITISD